MVDYMEITILRGPAIVHETLDAIRIYHHRIPQETYTWPGEICIPPTEITAIVNQACSVLDPTDPALNYYFQPWPLEVDPMLPACLAAYMITSFFELDAEDMDSAVQRILKHYQTKWETGFTASSIGCLAVELESSPANLGKPLTQAFSGLPVPEGLKRELAVVFSDYEKHMSRLICLMRPVAQELERLLAPWVERFDPLLERWKKDAETVDPQALLRSVPQEDVEKVWIRMRFIYEHMNQRSIWREDKRMHMHLRPTSCLCPAKQVPQDRIMDEHLTGLRLLGDRIRLDIMRLTMIKPRYCNELADLLGVNRGIVFRNLNSMYNCGLLVKVMLEGKLCYTVSIHNTQRLFEHIVEYIALPMEPPKS